MTCALCIISRGLLTTDIMMMMMTASVFPQHGKWLYGRRTAAITKYICHRGKIIDLNWHEHYIW